MLDDQVRTGPGNDHLEDQIRGFGISTVVSIRFANCADKLHARGLLGPKELTSLIQQRLRGNGQVRD